MNGALQISKGEGARAGKVQMWTPDGRGCAPSWQAAKAFARELIRPGLAPSANPHVIDVRVLEDGHVDVLLQGALWFSASAADARRIGEAILQGAGLVEEELDAERLIYEQALLTRTGALPGMGLTNHPKINDAAAVEAAHNRDLRRYVPTPNYAGKFVAGLPTLRQYSPDPVVAARQRRETMTPAEKRAEIARLEQEIQHDDRHRN